MRVDVRIIAATNRNLTQMVQDGRFREDLFYRLNVVSVDMPPLRDRKDDIAALAEFFVRRFAGELKKRVEGIGAGRAQGADAPQLARQHPRARERRRARGAAGRDGRSSISTICRSASRRRPAPSASARTVVKIPPTGIPLEEIERQAVVEALRMSNWVQKDAAELLGISPRVMNYKIKILNIEIPRGRRVAGADGRVTAATPSIRRAEPLTSRGASFRRPRMRVLVDLHQAADVEVRVALRRLRRAWPSSS